MVKYFFLIFFLSLASHAVEIRSIQGLNSPIIFQTQIESPQFLSVCQGQLWTFSVREQGLVAIDPTNGRKLQSLELKSILNTLPPYDITAISCFQDRLIVAYHNNKKKDQHSQLFLFTKDDAGKIQKPRVLNISMQGRMTDLFCNDNRCWALLDNIYTTENLSNWYQIIVPPPTELAKVNSQIDKNPFEDWQATLNYAKPKYYRGSVNSKRQLALLDTFHTQIVIEKNGAYVKWGDYGAWERSFLTPKIIRFISDEILAIADTNLKSIFLYSYEGQYLGVLSHKPGEIFSPKHLLGLASLKGRIFVADFLNNQVTALDIKSIPDFAKDFKPIAIRQNLFRRHAVDMQSQLSICLQCHDGLISSHLTKLTNRHKNHPFDCTQCHDPHHNSRQLHMLKNSPQKLCAECHQNNADPKTNHIWLKGKPGGNCTDCHRNHSEGVKHLVVQAPQLCINCHNNQSLAHREVKELTQLDRAKGITFTDGKISCTTCHQTHVNWREGGFLKNRDEVRVFCAACHGQKTDNLYKNFHKIINAKGVKK